MLEGLAAWVLNTYVGEYVENLNTDQLSIALLQGAVELDNLPLKKDALKSLGLPLEVKSGFIGKITLQIPLSRLHSEPWVICMERLYLVAGPLTDTKYDEAKEKAAESARKEKLLQALEAKWQVQQKEKSEASSWFSYGTSVLSNILENLQLKIKDVHLRYEDDVLNPACPFAFGVVIKELSAQSTDGAWVPKFVSRTNCDEMHKLIDLKNFAVYFDTNTTLVGSLNKSDMQDSLQREMYVSSITGKFKEHEYILSPVTSTAKMKRQTTELPLRSYAVPRNTIDLSTEKMAFNLTEGQYRNMALMLKQFDKFEKRKRFRKFRPSCSIMESPKSWWKFAISVHLNDIQERNRRLTKNYLCRRAQDVVRYTMTYKKELQKQSLDTASKKHKAAIEEEYSFEELKLLREIVYTNMRREGKVIKTPSQETGTVKAATPTTEDKGLLQRWFPGWGGWYGSQPVDVSSRNSDVGEPPPPKISKSELEQELSEVIEEVTRDGEDDKSTLKKDAVFAKLNFTLDSGSFKLLGVQNEPQTGESVPYSILELECSNISMLFESRPRTSGLKFGIHVGGLLLLDKLTENSNFPCLVGSQNKERFSSLQQTGTPGYQKTGRITTLTEDSAESTLFELMYEKNPPGGTANRKFSMKTKPLDIVYNKTAFTKVREIFSTKNLYASRKDELNIAASARRQYELLKKQTKQELKHTLDNLLEGTEGSEVKNWWVLLDISAPQIVIPESFQDPNTSMVMLDLGNLKFNNTATENTPDSQTNTEDDFHTPMSTPPSEPMDDDTGDQKMNIADLSKLDLTESQFYNKLYERYSLELTDLQVVVGRIKDNWRHIHHRGSTKLHLIDKFSITLQLERRVVYTTDPQWPSITVSGTLPQLTVHVNEHKVQTINRCLQTLSKKSPTSQYPTTSPTMSLAESSSGLDELREGSLAESEDSGSAGRERMLQEGIEDSQLLLMQFCINQLSLEIHSRERAVAELQVSGVKTNLTKRPYDTSVTLTVHSLLVVDALQTYGSDFELLVASHRSITLDSTSGSLRDSGPTSPQAASPGSPPSSPIEQLPTASVSSSLQTVQDAVSRAFQALVAKGTQSPVSSEWPDTRDTMVSPTLESEALIVVEVEMISSKSPSNTNNEGPLTIASFQFNNLDIIANQETIVEILSFLKQVSPRSMKSPSRPLSSKSEISKSTTDLFRFDSQEKESKPKLEMTADFNRLSLMFMRLDESSGIKTARKVSTATMTCARLQASIGNDLHMQGSLGGFHVFDISPDVQKHQRVFSVGQDAPHTNIPRQVYSSHNMYKTAHESVLMEELGCEAKAFEFSLSKPLSSLDQYMSYLDESQTTDDKNCIKVSLQVASLLYTHSPRVLFEMSQCLTEFKDYALSVANSLKKAATDVAKGMVAKRSDIGQNSLYGSLSSLDTYSAHKVKFSQSALRTEMDFLEGAGASEQEETVKSKIVLDASFETPVIVVPKSSTSSQVFVAHLGEITVSNTEGQGQKADLDDDAGEKERSDRVFMEVRDMNLYSVNLENDRIPSTPKTDGSLISDIVIDQIGTPIMYNTTIQLTLDHVSPDLEVINPDNAQTMDFSLNREMNDSFTLQEVQPLLDFNATIKTPVKLVLSKNVYEQILLTIDNLSYVEDVVMKNENSNAAVSGSEESNSERDSGSLYTAFKVETGSHKFTSSSGPQKPAVFMSKHLRFEVPLFSVELRGDFGEGEQGLVELKLHKFLLDYTKDNPATTNIQVTLKSLVMDDLLESIDSKHRQIMASKAQKHPELSEMEPHVFMSHSCPDNAIVAPVPIMPPSLPSSFHKDLSQVRSSPLQITTDFGFLPISSKGKEKVPRSKSTEYPCAPPPTPRATRSSEQADTDEDNLVHITILLVDKNSPEYTEKYNETKRFIDVDFSCLDTKINLQTWVILLDFLGLGAKVHDLETMQDPTAKPVQPDKSASDEYIQPVVNSEVNLKVEKLTITLNKPDYELAQASVSKLTSHISLRDGNFDASGELGKMLLVDLSPHGTLYREKFLTVGDHAMTFDFFKYGIPDPWLKRDYDSKLKLTMASVRYTHTNHFHAELLGFIQHFLQLQEVLGRIRASSAGKNINEAAFHSARILLEIEAGSPIILIPHSSRTTDVLVADLGTLSVKNCFRFDGDSGTFSAERSEEPEQKCFAKTSLSRADSQVSQKSDGMTSKSSSQSLGAFRSRPTSQGIDSVKQSEIPHPLTQSLFDELQPPRLNVDLMTESIYGSLEEDLRSEIGGNNVNSEVVDEIYDPTDKHASVVMQEGSSVDPVSPRASRQNLLLDSSFDSRTSKILRPPSSPALLRTCSSSSETNQKDRNVFSNNQELLEESDTLVVDKTQHKCLLDVLEIKMCDMDLFSAERVDKRLYKRKSLHQDLEFPSCVIQRTGGKLLKEKCLLNLNIERNLDGDISHSVPDWCVKGALSSVHCCLDIAQYKLIRGLLDHNLGEKFEIWKFKKDLMTHMVDPNIKTVLTGDVYTVISMSLELTNVTLELLTSHEQDPKHPQVSIAKLDFIRSQLSYDSYSDQSKETDLVSHEILASDTRFRDMAVNLRPSVFERILEPSSSASPDSLQMELHFRSTLDGTRFMVILNSMKIMCSFDWLIKVNEFIMTKAEDPFLTGGVQDEDIPENVAEVEVSSKNNGSRTASPLTTSGGIITKRGPQVDQTDVPFEFKLNVTDTQFVVLENLASLDTNAVILKCTAVLSFRPKAQDKLLACTLQSLEVFSCSLLAEEDTAMSIVDPMTIGIELNANPLPDLKTEKSAGLLDAKSVDKRELLLEVGFSTMNVRLSYLDLRMFLAIMNSLPKQALQARQSKSSTGSSEVPYSESQISQLQELGFSTDDCETALRKSDGDIEEAAVWLTTHAKIVTPKKDDLKITKAELKANGVFICLIDDCQDADVPLAELGFTGVNFNLRLDPSIEGKATFQIAADYYNRALSGWETLIEQWRCHTDWKHFSEGREKKFAVQISAQDVLNINLTRTLIDLYNSTKVKWTEDYYKEQEDSPQKEGAMSSAVRRQQMFTPYKVRNLTGSPLHFLTVTMSPSSVNSASLTAQKMDDAYIQATDWKMVPPNEEVAFAFYRREKIRHKKSQYLRVNQLVVKVDGWQRLSPVSVDKVGVYFRDTLPDITKHSIIKVNEGQPARVVFDVRQQGSALKVITLSSALLVSNQLDGPIDLRMENPIIPGRYEYMAVQKDQQRPIPMTFVNSKLWVKPSDWPVGYCRQPIEWQHVRKAGEISNSIRACEMSETSACYRYCVTIRRELYPHDSMQSRMPLPGHTLFIMPTVTMVNLLPVEMSYYFKGTEIYGTVKAGQEAQLQAADLADNIELGVHLENFPRCRELHIPPGTNNYKVKLRLYDSLDRLLELNVKILAKYRAALRLSISAPHWLVNKSGLPLVFRQDDCREESAGQFEEHELARSVTPLLFSFTEKELPNLCMMRLGKSVHGRAGVPQWCHSFSLDSGTGVRQLHVAPREGNRPDWVYNIGIEVKQGKGQFRNTNIVTFAPRYEIDNQSTHKLAIAQRHFTNKEAIRNPDGHLTALSKCKLPFHWPRQDLDQLLCVKLLDVGGCNWSGGFRIDKINSFHINMRDDRRNSQLLKVDILLQGPTYHIVFSDSQEVPPPFMIDNHAEVPVLYFQTKTHEDRLRTTIKPFTSVPYAWDEPTLDPYMTLSVANGTTSTYNLNILGEAEQLTYQNFIYISATATFPRSGHTYSELQNKELVLDCQHENHVVFKKKEPGKRSQLWRMTSNGMLEHEGQAPPMDPRKPTGYGSRHRLVLDIADIALQPGRPIPLALKKADERRAAKQTWKFKDGMLCSSTGNFCVQALNGIEGFQDGAIAMRGPGPTDPSDTSSIPLHMLVSSEKLHPGSGCLTVRVQMDGPVRVLQIADIRHRKVVRISSEQMEDWEIYEESLNKPSEKRKALATKNLELSLNLKGGIGISLVNQVREEILYLSLKNITVFYLASKRAVTMEMSVANIQADNQLFGTQRPVMLYVTPTSKKDIPDNTSALNIAAHKVPNANWNAEIFKHLVVSMKKLTVQLEEKLLWKLVQFCGYSQSDPNIQKLEDNSNDLQKTLAAATSVKSKRYYFGQLKINSSLITLSMITTAQLSPELRQLKKTMSIPLIRFEDAKVDLDPFSRLHLFDTSTFLVEEITTHYKEELKSQAAKILGSVDFLGNPLGLFNDVTEGVKGLIEEGNVGGLVKNVAHGFSNSTAKVVGSLSDGIGKVHLDTKHNTKREQIRSTHGDSGSGQLLSGVKGLGHGMLGGFKSVLKPFEGARKGGAEGFVVGLYEGVTGMVTKPVVGILDFASGTANAIRDTSRRSSHMQPARMREPRCCHGPGGLLPIYSEKQAEAQSLLYMLNDQRYEEEFLIALETVRGGVTDTLYALITSIQVYFLHSLEPHHDSIILNVMHKDLTQCRSVESGGRHYIEMTKRDDNASSSRSELKKPQIRCDKRTTAQKVVQQILYAKNLDDEQKQTLLTLPDDEDD